MSSDWLAEERRKVRIPKKRSWLPKSQYKIAVMSVPQSRQRDRVKNKSKQLEILRNKPTCMADIEKQLPFVDDETFDNFSDRMNFINQQAFRDYNISCDTGMKILAVLESPFTVLKEWEEYRMDALQEVQEMSKMEETVIKIGKKKKPKDKEEEKDKQKEKEKEQGKVKDEEKEKEKEKDTATK